MHAVYLPCAHYNRYMVMNFGNLEALAANTW